MEHMLSGSLGSADSGLGFIGLGCDQGDEVLVFWKTSTPPQNLPVEQNFDFAPIGKRTVIDLHQQAIITKEDAAQAVRNGAVLISGAVRTIHPAITGPDLITPFITSSKTVIEAGGEFFVG